METSLRGRGKQGGRKTRSGQRLSYQLYPRQKAGVPLPQPDFLTLAAPRDATLRCDPLT